jgi:hypothetical protein
MGKGRLSQIVTTSGTSAEPALAVVPAGKIEQTILLIRGERVIIDADLAELYGVDTKVLN